MDRRLLYQNFLHLKQPHYINLVAIIVETAMLLLLLQQVLTPLLNYRVDRRDDFIDED